MQIHSKINFSPYHNSTMNYSTTSTTITTKRREAGLITDVHECMRCHIMCVLPHARQRACDPKSTWDTWRYAWTDIQQPEACLQFPEMTTSSEIGGSSSGDETIVPGHSDQLSVF